MENKLKRIITTIELEHWAETEGQEEQQIATREHVADDVLRAESPLRASNDCPPLPPL